MKPELRKRIVETIAKIELAMKKPDAYGYLPDIRDSLQKILDVKETAPSMRSKMVGGLGRLVTECGTFSSSPLGKRIGLIATDFLSSEE